MVKEPSKWPTWLAAAALIGMIIGSAMALNGYLFGFGDHNEQLPQVRRMIDSQHLSRDWFVNQATADGGVRNYYSHLMALASQIFSEAESFWLIYVLTFLLMGAGIYTWARHYWQSHAVALLTLFLTVFNSFGSLGSSRLVVNALVPSFIAWAMLVWGLVLVEQRRWLLAVLPFSGCVFIHPLLGMEGFVLFFTWGLLRTSPGKHHYWHWIAGVGVFSVLASTVIFQQWGTTSVTAAEVVNIMAYMRHPWHYAPSTWPSEVYNQFFSFAAAIGVLAAWKWSEFQDLVLMLSMVGLACLVGTFFTEVYPIAIIAKLQPFRLTVLFQLVGALLLSSYCLETWRQGEYTGRVTSLAIIILLISASFLGQSNLVFWVFLLVLADWLRAQFFSHSPLGFANALLAAGLVGWITTLAWQAENYKAFAAMGILATGIAGAWWVDSEQHQPIIQKGLAALTGLVAITLLLWNHQLAMGKTTLPNQMQNFFGRIQGTLQYQGELDDVAQWALANTPADALFIVTPNYKSFRVKAERAIVVDFKSFVFDDDAMVEWLTRLKAVVGRDSLTLGYGYGQELKAYNSQSPERLLKTADIYGADYIVVRRQDQVLPLDLAYSNKTFAVFRVNRRQP
ncbi:MAG: DUF6798 domain-containing protein [Chloroflexota bacterium]|nr:DUF6798 domain-containing protein [Chloroflexota bacterium]